MKEDNAASETLVLLVTIILGIFAALVIGDECRMDLAVKSLLVLYALWARVTAHILARGTRWYVGDLVYAGLTLPFVVKVGICLTTTCS